jgi:Cu(I)/Ag(I) efflux system membrane fusion protein
VNRRLLTLTLALGACGGTDAPAPATGKEPMTTPYVAIQETLARDSLDELSKLSARVITAAEPVQSQAGVGEVIAGAGRVGAQDIDTARTAFSKLSMGLITYLKQHPAEREGLEVVFCPMAFNNQGAYWVQKAGDIINPYHGRMMLHCGDHVAWDKAPG